MSRRLRIVDGAARHRLAAAQGAQRLHGRAGVPPNGRTVPGASSCNARPPRRPGRSSPRGRRHRKKIAWTRPMSLGRLSTRASEVLPSPAGVQTGPAPVRGLGYAADHALPSPTSLRHDFSSEPPLPDFPPFLASRALRFSLSMAARLPVSLATRCRSDGAIPAPPCRSSMPR